MLQIGEPLAEHRAFDGAYAASFLRALKEALERHDWESELA